MKVILISGLIIFSLSGCQNKEPVISKNRSWEVNVHTGDTINRMDSNGKKQGIWIENKKDTIHYKDGVAL